VEHDVHPRAQERGQLPARERPQLALRHRRAARLQSGADVGELGTQHREVERPLRAVVVVPGRDVDPRARRDVAYGGAVEAALGSLETPDHERIDAWENRLRTHPRLRRETAESLARGSRYLPGLRRILEANGVPPSLALLPVIESGFYPTARGRRGERGLWQ